MTRLRAIEPDDLEMIFSLENDVSLWGLGATNAPYSRKLLSDFILNSTGDIYADKQLRLVIEAMPADGSRAKAVGVVDLINFDPKNLRAEVGIAIFGEYRGRGYASDALMKLEKYAIGTVHLHQLYAIVPVSNEPSRRLFLGRGYAEGSLLKDWLYDGKKYGDASVMQKIF